MIRALIPLALFAVLSTMLLLRLSDPRATNSVDYPLIGTQISQIDTRLSGPAIINIFASWCAPCTVEHPYLMQVQAQGLRIIGIAYKDAPEKTDAFLSRLGNPYETVIHDTDGLLGIELGITGVPESIAVAADGTILRRMQGAFTDAAAVKDFAP